MKRIAYALLAVAMMLTLLALPAAARDYSASDSAGPVVWRGKPEGGTYWDKTDPNATSECLEAKDFAYFTGIGSTAVTVDGTLDTAYENAIVYEIKNTGTYGTEGDKNVNELNPARDEAGTDVKYNEWAGKTTATLRGVWNNDKVYFFVDVNDSTVYSERTEADGDRIEFSFGPPIVGQIALYAITPTASGALVTALTDVGSVDMLQAATAWKLDDQQNKIGYTVEFSVDMKNLIANANTGNLLHWFRFIEEQCNANPQNPHLYYRDWADWFEANSAIQAGGLVDFNLHVIDNLSKDGDSAEEIEANKNTTNRGDNKLDAILSWSSYGQYQLLYSVGSGRLYMGCAEHTFGEPTVVKAATHTEEGLQGVLCSTCTYSEGQVIPKIEEHTYDEYEAGDENQHKKVCACGEFVMEDHAWGDEQTVITEPTVDAEGLAIVQCTICLDSKNVVLEKLDPADVTTEAPTTTTAPTATEAPTTTAPATTEKKGCGASLAVAFPAILTLGVGMGVLLRKKKED